jgi:predicted  nucleic acid-binding Zn-ribbon protein
MPDHYHESVRISDETLVNNLLDIDVDDEIADRKRRITDQIQEVKQELERRENIHEENERDLQSQLVRQNELIQKVSAGIEPDGEMRDRKQQLHEELRRERKEAFQDVKELNRELRELRKQREKLDSGLLRDY